MVISLFLWCLITITRVFCHSPWYDEAHAWLIAQDLNLFEIIKLMKIEGHTFIWYLFLMPFAKTNFMYPYSMLLLNWLFCFVAILILWLKSPFNNWIKFLISFSFPFLALYPVVARCYAIGILLLFMLASMENKKLEHPNWYALLLIFCANTSIMAAVGATVFGVIFLHDMIKNKTKVITPLSIMLLGAVVVLMQLPLNLSGNVLITSLNLPFTINFFKSVFFSNFLVLNILLILFLVMLILIFCVKNRTFPIFLVSTYTLLFCVFFRYIGAIWHHFFFYIYFIISCWLLFSKYDLKKLSWKNIINFMLIFISLLFICWQPAQKDIYNVWNSKVEDTAKLIAQDKNLLNSNILVFEMTNSVLKNDFRDKNIKVINYCSQNNVQWDIRPYYKSENCTFDGFDNTLVMLDDDVISKFYTQNTYIFTSNKIKNLQESFSMALGKYSIVLYKDYGPNKLWKVNKIK